MTVDAIKVAATEAGVLQTKPAGVDAAGLADALPVRPDRQRVRRRHPAPTTDLVEGINQAQTVEEVMALMSSHNDPRTGTGLPHHLEPAVTPPSGGQGSPAP